MITSFAEFELARARIRPAATNELVEALPQKLRECVECELKYFIPRESIDRHFREIGRELHSFESETIKQRFYPQDEAARVGEMLLDHLDLDVTTNQLQFIQARLRKICGEEESYFIEAKARIPGIKDRLSKLEFSISVEAGIYEQEKCFADAGRIEKVRTRIPGHIRDDDGHFIPLMAEIDQITSCGLSKKRGELKSANRFYTVDVELPDPRQIPFLREGRHNFEFLEGAIELTSKDPVVDKLRKELRTSYLAKHGYSSGSARALAALSRLSGVMAKAH